MQRHLIVPAVLVGLNLCGCAPEAPKPVQTMVVAEGKKELSPEERERNYHHAFQAGLRSIREEQYGAALAAFEEAVKMNPDSTEAMFNLAACHEAVGDPLRAIHFYKSLAGRNPKDPDCYTNLGTSYIKMYYREKTPSWREMAIEAWRRSLAIRRDQPHVQKFLAQARAIE